METYRIYRREVSTGMYYKTSYVGAEETIKRILKVLSKSKYNTFSFRKEVENLGIFKIK